MNFRSKIIELLTKSTNLEGREIENLLAVPPNSELGDFAFPCFTLKNLSGNPKEAAEKLKAGIEEDGLPDFIKEIKVVGPYCNFYLNPIILAQETLRSIFNKKIEYGHENKNSQRILVEYVGPNTNKSLHLGHLRNAALGISVSNLLEAAGYDVVRVNINNDRGMGICEAMLGYMMFHEEEEPTIKPDHFVAQCYVEFKQAAKKDPSLQEKAKELLVKWEAGDKDTVAIWKKMVTWVLEGYQETYKKLGVTYNKEYFESEIYKEGKKIVEKGLQEGIFEKEDGAVIANLEEFKLPNKVLQKSDGTAVYMTQDLYLANLRKKEFGPHRAIYVVGNDHELHFKQLFTIFGLLNFEIDATHVGYGLVNLPTGRMKSREGTVVDADDIIEEMQNLAQKEIKQRHSDLSQEEVQKRSEMIALGALKYFMLQTDPKRNIVFNPEESLSFEGDTGPYIQYAHARCNSILAKANQKVDTKVHFESLSTEYEKKVILHLSKFSEVVKIAAEQYKPYLVAKYVFDLAQLFSEFYHNCPVITDLTEVMHARLLLVNSVRQVLENGLKLLGIDAPKQM